MIKKATEQWSRFEDGIGRAADGDSPELDNILEQIRGVRDVLQRMSQVSVTRSSLRSAVRDALLPLIQEHRDELFPEIAELRARLEAAGAHAGESAGAAPAGGREAAIARLADDGADGAGSEAELSLPASAVEEISGGLPPQFLERLESFEARIQRLLQSDAKSREDIARLGDRTARLDDSINRLDDQAAQLDDRTSRTDERSTKLNEKAGWLEIGLKSLDDRAQRVDETVQQIGARLVEGIAALDATQETRRAELKSALSAELENTRFSVEEKIAKVQEYLRKLEETMPRAAEAATQAAESRLHGEIEAMTEQLAAKIGEVQAFLARLEEVVPRRQDLEAVDRRLAGLETALERLGPQVSRIESLSPEIESIGERFSDLRREIQDACKMLDLATGDARAALGARLEDLQRALRDGISRWESDQSRVLERLSGMRDALRDQLGALSQQVGKEKATLWGKLSGRKESGLKLSSKDVDDLSGRLESIISGLEGVIARGKQSD